MCPLYWRWTPMTEKDTELSRRLVVGHKRDGRCCYDREAKRELVEASMRPGVSVSRMALQHGINANLLRKWIHDYRCQHDGLEDKTTTAGKGVAVRSTFMPVIEVKAPVRSSPVRIVAQLPNGVRIDLGEPSHDDLSSMLHMFSALPCSDSTKG
ncbi:MAG: transposase [Gallionellaceae bacterium]